MPHAEGRRGRRRSRAHLEATDWPDLFHADAVVPREPTALHQARLDTVVAWLQAQQVRRVADLGCGDGLLVQRLLADERVEQVVAVDLSLAALGRLGRWAQAAQAAGRLALVHGSFTEAHRELQAVDAVAMVETIEHVPTGQLSAVEHVVFEQARPRCVLVTTPNQEYNELFGMSPGQMREPGHHFEWPRARFATWATGVAQRHRCQLRLQGIGPADALRGAPKQMATFLRCD